jgi:hypothetical protein
MLHIRHEQLRSWMSDEMKAIRDACKDDSYDFNIK